MDTTHESEHNLIFPSCISGLDYKISPITLSVHLSVFSQLNRFVYRPGSEDLYNFTPSRELFKGRRHPPYVFKWIALMHPRQGLHDEVNRLGVFAFCHV